MWYNKNGKKIQHAKYEVGGYNKRISKKIQKCQTQKGL